MTIALRCISRARFQSFSSRGSAGVDNFELSLPLVAGSGRFLFTAPASTVDKFRADTINKQRSTGIMIFRRYMMCLSRKVFVWELQHRHSANKHRGRQVRFAVGTSAEGGY